MVGKVTGVWDAPACDDGSADDKLVILVRWFLRREFVVVPSERLGRRRLGKEPLDVVYEDSFGVGAVFILRSRIGYSVEQTEEHQQEVVGRQGNLEYYE